LSDRRFHQASDGFKDPKDGDSAASVAQESATGENMLVMEGSDTRETPDLAEGTAKSLRRGGALESL
jgi:hypothetical protein